MKTAILFRLFALASLVPSFAFGQWTLYYNAKIFTANRSAPFATAIAISGKKILAVGTEQQLRKKLKGKGTLINCEGGFIAPGFIDAHMHALSGGNNLLFANLEDQDLTIDQLVTYAEKCFRNKEGMSGDVLVIYGINITTWSQLEEISSKFNSGIFSNIPLVLSGSDGHTSWANRTMMELAGLNKSFLSKQPADKQLYYGKDSDGNPTGFLSEEGQNIIEAAVPVKPGLKAAARKAMEYSSRLGITGWLDPSAGNTSSVSSHHLEAYRWLSNNGLLNAHIATTLVADPNQPAQAQLNRLALMKKKYAAGNLSVIGCKIFADGVVEHPTQTAALSIPYTGTTSKGVLMFEPASFARFATLADKENWLVHVHAIGDRAVSETLNGFAAMRKANGHSGIPHTITHLQLVNPTDAIRMSSLKIIAAFQLLWAFGDATTIDIVQPYIHPSLYQWQYPARTLKNAGVVIAGASDWPVSSANPFQAIYRAVTRKGPKGVLDSSQTLLLEDMLYAYTLHAAKAMRADTFIGSLEAGKYADMIRIDRNLLEVPIEEVEKATVLETIFEGKVIYRKKQP
ncbi:MAG: amidohydrolase [Sediminibacterium sp.]